MKRIGLTGGIGSGKSTVAKLLAQHGLEVIDADKIAREVVEPGQPALEELVAHFGEEILTPTGELDRKQLALLAFASPEETQKLNEITHPRIEERTAALMTQASLRGEKATVWDMPLLVDKGYQDMVDEVIVVDVDPEVRVQRLVKYRGLDEADARQRIKAQIPDEERKAAATFIIDNNGPIEALEPQVQKFITERL